MTAASTALATTRETRVRRALRWEACVQLAAHPLVFPWALLLRRLGTVVDVPGVGHVVNDAEIARAVLTDTEHFSKNGPGSAGELITQVMGEYALLNLEGGAHRQLRSILLPALNAAAVHDLVGQVWGAGLDEALTLLRSSRPVDLARLTAVLTGRTMRRLLGIGQADDEAASLATFRLGEEMVGVVRLRSGPLRPQVVSRARDRFLAMTDDLAAGIGQAPLDSIIGRLASAGLGEGEVRGVGAALLLTGTGTVSTALPRTVALISDGHLWDQVGERATRLAVIDECLRVITPSPVMLRSVERDTTIAGYRFKRGRRVAVVTYSAVRSFQGGDGFAPEREPPASVRGLYFGAGIHHCIGYALARAELDLSIQRLHSVAPLEVGRRIPAFHVLIPRYGALEVWKRP